MPGINRRALLNTLLLGFSDFIVPVFAGNRNPYFQTEVIDLKELLVPPPSIGSEQSNLELKEIKLLQSSTSEHRKHQARFDTEEGLIPFLSTTDLRNFVASELPLTVELIQRVLDTQDAITNPVKRYFNRPRPSLVDQTVELLVSLPASGSYPSGHATGGTAIAILLSRILAMYRDGLMYRAADYATSRLIVGVHYRSDIESGFAAGALLARTLLEHAEFAKDFTMAKAEIIDAAKKL